ncbi:hypothetical protein C8A03DRAFT_44548 [Achaetomium macrosporum]|uniref:Uncharacterized protein n=1 Tax=Achaetomium macrosporum TaxID=79813 RepID=A0AAN7HEY3_9PEZI|nr:hypothetical protein C8A03DRAFT_44548 [Achaetomium macrosporum]
MGLQLEPVTQALEQYGPWHFRDVRFRQDHRAELQAALLQTAAIPGLSDTLREISKAGRADCHSSSRPEVTLPVLGEPEPTAQEFSGRSSPGRCTPAATADKIGRSLFPTTLHPFLGFRQIVPSGEDAVTFSLSAPAPPPRPCLKRRRPATDVDGPGTYSLSCKKRRLLRHLITSRLSQPFSLPATYILNRESVATGDKRFVKLAAIMSARRLNSAVTAQSHPPALQSQQPSPSTWLRRAAVLNRLRSRVCAEVAERGQVQVADLAAKAAVFQQGHGNSVFVGGRYLVTMTNVNQSPTAAAPMTPGPRGVPHSSSCPSPPPNSSAGAMLSPPGLRLQPSIHVPTPGPPPTCGTCLRIPNPKLRPLRSPELRVTRPLVPLEDIEELDNDGVAFPTSEHESRYEDEPEEVYADFSVIFGGGDGDDSDEEGGGRDHFEDYMDDLDGIPWNARC